MSRPGKFNNLTEEEKQFIINTFKQYSSYGDRASMNETLGKRFGVTPRQIRKWAKKLGLNRDYKPRVVTKSPEGEQNFHKGKILVLDIETSPMKSYIWGLWNQNIGHNMKMLLNDWFMLSFSAKWLFEEDIFSAVLTPEEVLAENDERIVKYLWSLINSADIVIAHNGKKFDMRRINTRFLKHRLPHPMPYIILDTLLYARKELNVSSNRLDYLGEFLGVGNKRPTDGFDLWKRCMSLDQDALNEMVRYNEEDVFLLERVYLEMRPFIKPHPNLGLYITEDVESCPSCGSRDLESGGVYATSVNTYEAFRCKSCGSVGRSRKSKSLSKTKLLTPIAR